ncbi:MAG TPA: hypothetical protein VFA07_03505 [Chthonomonadaceae bacterium]|nr:hypothetical protein [Chthonomonadaceae bacterium]
MKRFALLVSLPLAACLMGCSSPEPSGTTTSDTPATSSSAAPASQDASDTVFAVPADTNPVYKIVKEDFSKEGDARYLRAKIVVPAGLSRQLLEANIRHAAKTLYEKYQPTGMFVFANKEGTDIEGPYTAGRCDFHPTTKDKHDPTITLSDCQADIDLVDDYFKSGVDPPKSLGNAKLDRLLGIDPAAWEKIHRKLSESQRRAIYYEIGEADDRASTEAQAQYSDLTDADQKTMLDQIGKKNQREEDLTGKYERRVAKKYRLRSAELSAIKDEGLRGSWPLPPSD